MLRRAVVEICTSERTFTFTPTFQFIRPFEHLACDPALSFGDEQQAWMRLDPSNYPVMSWIKARSVKNMKSPGEGRGEKSKTQTFPRRGSRKVSRESIIAAVCAYVSVMWAAGA